MCISSEYYICRYYLGQPLGAHAGKLQIKGNQTILYGMQGPSICGGSGGKVVTSRCEG